MSRNGKPFTAAEVQHDFDVFVAGVEEVGPTRRAFQAALGLSSSSVATYHLERLEREGLIERRSNGGSHSFRLTALGRERAQRDALTVRRSA